VDKIRILVADDHAVVREGLRTLISSDPDMELVGEATDGMEAVGKAAELLPDVILMDLVMPRMEGIEAIRAILQRDASAKILVLTSFSEDERVFAALRLGALGYLLKDSLPSDLLSAIRIVSQGKSSLDPSVAYRVVRELRQPALQAVEEESLTERELTVLRLVARGMSNAEIAKRLNLSPWTVRTHVRNILGKLQLENRTQATLYALRHGIVDLN